MAKIKLVVIAGFICINVLIALYIQRRKMSMAVGYFLFLFLFVYLNAKRGFGKVSVYICAHTYSICNQAFLLKLLLVVKKNKKH